jgi:hypothetical protein
VEALVDGVATPLEGLPLADASARQAMADTTQLVLISATQQASVKLRATDDGQTQELDLRTGAAGGHGYQQSDAEIDWAAETPATLPAPLNLPGMKITLMNQIGPSATTAGSGGHAALSNYQESGWSAPGQAFLVAPIPALLCIPAYCIPYHLTFDDASTFSFVPAGGAPIPAQPHHRIMSINAPNVHTDSDPDTVVFTVPDNVTNATIIFDLGTSQLINSAANTESWTAAPHAISVNLTLR